MIKHLPSLLQLVLFIPCLASQVPSICLPWRGPLPRLLPLSPALVQPSSLQLLASHPGSPQGQSPSLARSGAGMVQTDPLNGFFQIVVHLSSGHRLWWTAWPELLFLNWKHVADVAVNPPVSLFSSFKDLCHKIDVVPIFFKFFFPSFFSESVVRIIFTGANHIFLNSHLCKWWICFGISTITLSKEEKKRHASSKGGGSLSDAIGFTLITGNVGPS